MRCERYKHCDDEHPIIIKNQGINHRLTLDEAKRLRCELDAAIQGVIILQSQHSEILPSEAGPGDEGFLPKSETCAEGWYPFDWILPVRHADIKWRRKVAP